jgi:hypothetical protein
MLTGLLFVLVSCSDDSLIDLGGRSSDWIGEVATTATTTTTTPPIVTQSAVEAEWINDQFGAPDPELDEGRVLAAVFARSGDSSQFLQASREEIVAVAPDIQFPSILPVAVSHVTSQLVIESRELVLADDPTVAFGLWSVEPYTRSRSVGQAAVLNVSRDPEGVELAQSGDLEATCTSLITGDRVCAIEEFTDWPVWRLEDAGGVIHVWYADPFRYQLHGFGAQDEDLVHQVIGSATALGDLLPEQ